jgi:hypothetical protein
MSVGIRAKALLILLAVFLAGAATGSAVAVHVAARRMRALFEGEPQLVLPRLYGATLDRRLHLTADQRRAVERIVEDDHAERARIGQTVYPQLVELRRRRHARIREVLTAEQRVMFDPMIQELELRRRQDLDLDTP